VSSLPHGPAEHGDRQAAIDELLERIGASTGGAHEWWNHSSYEQLGGQTPTEAWLAGDRDGVVRLILEWYDKTEESAERTLSDPITLRMIEDRRRSIAEEADHRRSA
jgi:hypothetical protein